MFIRCTIIAIAALGCMSRVLADTTAWEAIAARGQQQLAAGNCEAAREEFAVGLAQARETGDEEWTARFLFYQANAYLIEAGEPSYTSEELARRAIRYYQEVLELRPESGSVMVNLARSLALMGRDEQAESWYRRAIAVNDDKQVLYRQQYAEFLQRRDPGQAAKQLRQVVESQPKNVDAHRKLVTAYRQTDYAEQLPDYLRQQVHSGEVLRAQRAALDALADPDWPDQYKPDLMAVVAESLASQHNVQAGFSESETARALRIVARVEPDLRVCVGELVRTITAGGRPVTYRWWIKDETRTAAISQLLRSVARSYQQANDPVRAEKLYRQAIELRGEADPRALRDLVDFYSERGDYNGINDLSNSYELQLFEGKGQAYQSGDIQAIYDYHRTLASIYANQAAKTGDWGSTSKSNSAAFQLEHAYNTAQRSGTIKPDTQLVEQLAQSYEATRGQGDATRFRVEAAEAYTQSGDTQSADKVLKPVRTEGMSPDTRIRYDRLIRPELDVSPITERPQENLAVPRENNVADPRRLELQRPSTQLNVAPVSPADVDAIRKIDQRDEENDDKE